MTSVPRCKILATGQCLPGRPVSNADFIAAHGLETTPAWIEERTGITQRYFVGEGETTSTLAAGAALQALKRAGGQPEDIDAVVVATCTPDYTFPSVAALVQTAVGMRPGTVALDVNAACSGFIAALSLADGLFATQPEIQRVLVIGAETFSNVIDVTDRSTSVLFGDGAGAILLERTKPGEALGLLTTQQGADGSGAGLLHSAHGVARGRQAGTVHMQGAAVFKHAVRQMGDRATLEVLLARSGHRLEDVAWLVPHQANARIITAAAEMVGIPLEKVVMTVDQHANTSAASIPLALDVAMTDGRLQPGQLVVLQAFGAGFTWGAATILI